MARKKAVPGKTMSFAEWMKQTGPTEELTHDNGKTGSERTFIRVVQVPGTHHVERFDEHPWVRRLMIMRTSMGESVFAYDTDGHLVTLWTESMPRSQWVTELVNALKI